MEIAGVVNVLNKTLAEKRYALMGPGRWGSNDINLGVKVTYANINKARLLVEVAFAKEGYTRRFPTGPISSRTWWRPTSRSFLSFPMTPGPS